MSDSNTVLPGPSVNPTTIRADDAADPEVRAAWCLARARSPRTHEIVSLVRRSGSCRTALARLEPEMPRADRLAAERGLERAWKRGYRIIALTDPAFPRLLRHLPDPPLAMTVWGRLEAEDALSISVVGSRRASPYGLAASRRLSGGLARRGITVVSGLARGIDGAAHRGALEAGGRTLAVLGSGLSNLYPREHRELAERVAGNGAVLSELDLDEPPRRENFPRRNRIITGLAMGTLVVEAAPKSGSLISARLALDQNREVFAVPGPIGLETSAGVNDLIRAGARLVTSAEDLIDDLPDEVQKALVAQETDRTRPISGGPARDGDADERSILAALSGSAGRALDVDDILDRVALSVDRVLSALSRLELRKRIRRYPGGFFHTE